MIKYYDIGLNLFCKQFREPEKIIGDAAMEGVSCILTGCAISNAAKRQRLRSHEYTTEYQICCRRACKKHACEGR